MQTAKWENGTSSVIFNRKQVKIAALVDSNSHDVVYYKPLKCVSICRVFFTLYLNYATNTDMKCWCISHLGLVQTATSVLTPVIRSTFLVHLNRRV